MDEDATTCGGGWFAWCFALVQCCVCLVGWFSGTAPKTMFCATADDNSATPWGRGVPEIFQGSGEKGTPGPTLRLFEDEGPALDFFSPGNGIEDHYMASNGSTEDRSNPGLATPSSKHQDVGASPYAAMS